jgi:hypothetical protein
LPKSDVRRVSSRRDDPPAAQDASQRPNSIVEAAYSAAMLSGRGAGAEEKRPAKEECEAG